MIPVVAWAPPPTGRPPATPTPGPPPTTPIPRAPALAFLRSCHKIKIFGILFSKYTDIFNIRRKL